MRIAIIILTMGIPALWFFLTVCCLLVKAAFEEGVKNKKWFNCITALVLLSFHIGVWGAIVREAILGI